MAAESMQTLVLRHGVPEEKSRLFCLIGEFFADPDLRREFGRPMTSTPDYAWIVTLDGDAVASFAAVVVHKGGTAELRHAYTLPQYRGRGLNGEIVAQRIEVARAAGATDVRVVVEEPRIPKYEALGFKPFGSRGKYRVLNLKLSPPRAG